MTGAIKKAKKEINKDIPNSVILINLKMILTLTYIIELQLKKSGLVAKEKLTVLFPV